MHGAVITRRNGCARLLIWNSLMKLRHRAPVCTWANGKLAALITWIYTYRRHRAESRNELARPELVAPAKIYREEGNIQYKQKIITAPEPNINLHYSCLLYCGGREFVCAEFYDQLQFWPLLYTERGPLDESDEIYFAHWINVATDSTTIMYCYRAG